LTPVSGFFLRLPIYRNAPRGEGKKTPGARGSITTQYYRSQVFYRAKKKYSLIFLIRRGGAPSGAAAFKNPKNSSSQGWRKGVMISYEAGFQLGIFFIVLVFPVEYTG
jgi:hypothetical protein